MCFMVLSGIEKVNLSRKWRMSRGVLFLPGNLRKKRRVRPEGATRISGGTAF